MFQNFLKNKDIEIAKKAVEKNPTNIIKLSILGQLYAENNFYKEAIATLEKVLKLEENYLPALELLGKIYIKTKQYLKAYRTLLELYNASEHNFKVKTMLFSLKDADCDDEAKIIILNGLLEIEPNESTKETLAKLYLKTGQFIKSATTYEELIDNEQKPEYLRELSNIYIKLKKYSSASISLEKLMQTEDFNTQDAKTLAEVYTNEKRFQEAKGIWELLIDTEPHNTEFFKSKIAQILMQENNPDEVIEVTKNVIEVNEYSQDAKFLQADALLNKKEYAKAIEFLREFYCDPIDKQTEQKIEEKIINISILYSQELRAEKKYVEAIDALMPALRYNENQKEIYIELARISTEIRDYSSAKEYMKIAEEL